MKQPPYLYEQLYLTRYTFVSEGQKRIRKVVDFSLFGIIDTYNLAFGDLLPDGSIDDEVNSNNGDIVRVLSTVVAILKDFTAANSRANIVFTGSTEGRMRLYTRILRTYYATFVKEFEIKAIVMQGDNYVEVEFDSRGWGYAVFIIKRKM
ncbi:MAG: hypothetical protein JST68_29135 [Bacteroidetes bacterium]|nr:hypothetical protein [Bacteroidota bacterium]